ncbi:YifB family Mg chelatase-like AAA ATPase [Nocardia carnea]|uniref:YifB family Mg chelatase-like AAA ATPase n=1 Tax=Nocardia carnea TaxID=37328 RepID=UPI002453C756|nr:YifB family Mg chelatase-like AAA ATPase [Nocardia carnea]
MTHGRACSIAVRGIDGQVVAIEADIQRGLPSVHLPDLPGIALQESGDRVRVALTNAGEPWPDGKLIVRLSPAQIPVVASVLDLALAAAVSAAAGLIPSARPAETVLLGELAFDGRLRTVRGILPAVLAARNAGYTTVVVPDTALPEAGLVTGIDVLGASTLREVLDWLRGRTALTRPTGRPPTIPRPATDLSQVTGRQEARRALELAAAGGHHLLLTGPSQSAKTALAQCLPGLLPPLSAEEAMEVAAIQSVAGTLDDPHTCLTTAPFIAPHHSTSISAMFGGGTASARPGAVTRAHRGVLFLDDCTDINSRVLEALRAPLEEGQVCIARRDGVVRYPSRFHMMLATTGCPCDAMRKVDCVCAPLVRRRHLGRLSGPILDRIDLVAQTHPAAKLGWAGELESSATVRERVVAARRVAAARWRLDGCRTNAEVPGPVLRRRFPLTPQAAAPLEAALRMGRLSARGVDRTLRVSWTICDLREGTEPTASDIEQALDLRALH